MDKQDPDSGFRLLITDLYTLIDCVIVEHLVDPDPDNGVVELDGSHPMREKDHLQALPYFPKTENANVTACEEYLTLIGTNIIEWTKVRTKMDKEDERLS